MFGRKDTKQGLPSTRTDVEVMELETTEEKTVDTAQREDNGVALLRREDMQRSSSASGRAGALLGRGCRFEGKLTFEGTVQIEGEFIGDIDSPGHLIVSEGARIEGSLNVASADISGDVHAKITTAGALELRSTAKVVGELTVAALVIERGARFEGQVKMTE